MSDLQHLFTEHSFGLAKSQGIEDLLIRHLGSSKELEVRVKPTSLLGDTKKYIHTTPTPQKFNLEPKHEGLEDVFPFQMGNFQVPC